MAKSDAKWRTFILEFVGSLFYLAVFFTDPQIASLNLWSGSGGALWLPFFVGIAAIASVALFFISFGNLMGMKGNGKYAMMATKAGGITLAALSFGSGTYFWASVIGFILGFIGSSME